MQRSVCGSHLKKKTCPLIIGSILINKFFFLLQVPKLTTLLEFFPGTNSLQSNQNCQSSDRISKNLLDGFSISQTAFLTESGISSQLLFHIMTQNFIWGLFMIFATIRKRKKPRFILISRGCCDFVLLNRLAPSSLL